MTFGFIQFSPWVGDTLIKRTVIYLLFFATCLCFIVIRSLNIIVMAVLDAGHICGESKGDARVHLRKTRM
jgi:hypothetical protein